VPKIGANWFKIKTGDIISFRYKPTDKTKPLRTHSIMVLNPKYPKTLKDGKIKFYINGLKLEGSNVSIFTNKTDAWRLLKKQAVFYEPIKLPKDKIMMLENQRHAKLTGNKLWKGVKSGDPEVGLNE
jgi:hypothetical protein